MIVSRLNAQLKSGMKHMKTDNYSQTFKFACPHCGQHLEAEPDWAGMEVECPTCGKAITVPEPAGRQLSPAAEDQDAPPFTAAHGEMRPVDPPSPPPPVIQTVTKADGVPPPSITVVKKREGFFVKNRKWLIPVASGAVALLVVVGLVAVKQKSKKHRFRGRTTNSSPSRTYNHAPGYTPPSSGSRGGVREFVRNHIDENGNCRIVSITQIGGDIVVCGDNNWAANGCSRSITDALQEITDDDERIIDVCLTELGRFVVLYGRNAGRWNNLPSDMEYHLRRLNANDEELYSATLNDAGDWIVVGSEHYASSATWLKEWLAEGVRKYGTLRAATVSTDAAVAVYDGGYRFYGNVPEDMKSALRETTMDVRIIKIAGSAWFFADSTGYRYRYKM